MHKLIGVFGQQLRHDIETLAVERVELLARPLAKGGAQARRRDERSVVALERAEALRMHAAEHMSRDPLHGGKRQDFWSHHLGGLLIGCDGCAADRYGKLAVERPSPTPARQCRRFRAAQSKEIARTHPNAGDIQSGQRERGPANKTCNKKGLPR